MIKGNDQPVEGVDIISQSRIEQVSLLASLGQPSFLISITNGLLTVYILRQVTESIFIYGWLAALVSISLLRMAMVAQFWGMDKSPKQLKRWVFFYLLSVYTSAFCWGVLPLWGGFFEAEWTEIFIVFLIAGMSAGGLVSLFPLLTAAIPYFLIILVPLIVILSAGEHPAHYAMAILASLYLVFLVRSTVVLNKSAIKTIRLEIENAKLFEFLSAANRNQASAKLSQDSAVGKNRQPTG